MVRFVHPGVVYCRF